MTRRDFITQSAFATVGSTLTANALATTATSHHVRLGGPIFAKASDPEELAQAHVDLGYRAAYCPGVTLKEPDRIRAFSEAFSRRNIVIAEVGRWVNLMDRNPDKQKANLAQVTEGLALADEIGALCCVDIAGSRSPVEWFGPHPENLGKDYFDAAVRNARAIIDAVKPKRAKFCYEVMGWALPDGPDTYLKLLKAIDRKQFGVHLDPANAVNSPRRFYENSRLLDDCFDVLGKYIVSFHAKDLIWQVEMNLHFVEVRPGAGSMDFTKYLKRLAMLPHQPPLMMEHLPNAEEYDQGRKHLLNLAQNLGIRTD